MQPANGSSAGPDQPLPGARTALIVLLAINLFNYIDRYVLSAVVPQIQKEFFENGRLKGGGTGDAAAQAFMDWIENTFSLKADLALTGSLSLAFMVAYMCLTPLFGWWAERSRRWLIVAIGVLLWSLATGASGLAVSFGLLFLTRCLVGVGEAAYGPTAPTMISDLYPVKVRGKVMAWFYMAIPVGSALGFVLGGAVAGMTGDWRWAFYLVVPPGVLLGLWAFFLPEPRRGQADRAEKTRQFQWSDVGILLRTPSYVLCTLGMTAMTFALGGLGFWVPYYVHVVREHGEATTVPMIFGVITVITGLGATLLGGLAGDKLRDKIGGAYFLVSGIAMIVGFPFLLAIIYVPFPLAWVFVFFACFCLFFNTGPTNTVLANVSHPSMRATAFALNIFFIHLFGDAISPMIIGMISGAYDMNVAFGVVGAAVVIGGLFWLWGTRYLDRDTALATTRV